MRREVSSQCPDSLGASGLYLHAYMHTVPFSRNLNEHGWCSASPHSEVVCCVLEFHSSVLQRDLTSSFSPTPTSHGAKEGTRGQFFLFLF